MQISVCGDRDEWLSWGGGAIRGCNLCEVGREWRRLKCLPVEFAIGHCSNLITETQWDIIFTFYIMKLADGRPNKGKQVLFLHSAMVYELW